MAPGHAYKAAQGRDALKGAVGTAVKGTGRTVLGMLQGTPGKATVPEWAWALGLAYAPGMRFSRFTNVWTLLLFTTTFRERIEDGRKIFS